MSQTNDQTKGSSALKSTANKVTKIAVSNAAGSLGIPVFIGIVTTVLFVVAGSIIMAFVILSSAGEQTTKPEESNFGGEISDFGQNEIPAQYIPIYKAAQEKYGVPLNLLAAEHRVETRFSTLKNMVSPVGAIGGLQFMPLTWLGWGYPGGDRLGNANIPNNILTNPAMIKKYGGYGVDADGDGKADPWDIRYVKGYVEVNKSEAASRGNTGVAVVDVGNKWIGNYVYVFGGGRNQSDIARGRFDCSSFVHWAFAQVRINLGPLSSTSTDTLKYLGKPVSPDEMKPGDLVFFDTYKPDGHVGIYIGNGRFIGAQTCPTQVGKPTTLMWFTASNVSCPFCEYKE